MLQYLWACNTAFFIYMSDQQDGCMRFFGKTENRCRTLTYLGNASGRSFNIFRGNSLYGVDNDQVGTGVLDMHVNLFK